MKERKGTVYTRWKWENGEPYFPTIKAHGFVYCVTDTDGRRYVGKKMIRANSDWRTYATSHYELRKAIFDTGEDRNLYFDFVVLWECADEPTLRLCEAVEMCKQGAYEYGYNSSLIIRKIGKIDEAKRWKEDLPY